MAKIILDRQKRIHDDDKGVCILTGIRFIKDGEEFLHLRADITHTDAYSKRFLADLKKLFLQMKDGDGWSSCGKKSVDHEGREAVYEHNLKRPLNPMVALSLGYEVNGTN